MHVIIPVKAFDAAKARLADTVPPDRRRDLARRTAGHVVRTCIEVCTSVVIVTADDEVARWAGDHGCFLVDDPMTGLDDAAQAGVAAVDGAWCVVHGDLPLLAPSDIRAVAAALEPGTAVLSPSRDGGTNVLGATEPLAFAYGPGSFGRHLAAAAHLDRRVVVTPGTVVDIDSGDDLARASALPGGEWLRTYLPSTA